MKKCINWGKFGERTERGTFERFSGEISAERSVCLATRPGWLDVRAVFFKLVADLL